MKIAVLGCAGGMGAWFSKLFIAERLRVTGSDLRGRKLSLPGLKFVDSNPRAAEGADLVVLAVPATETLKVAREISPHLKRGSVVIEITSIKGNIPDELRRTFADRAALLSLHPLFGPLSNSPRPKIAVVGGTHDLSLARTLFPKAELVLMEQMEHDRLMASALSLVHLINLAFASTVTKAVGTGIYDRISTPIGSAQMNLAKAVLSGSPSLSSFIQLENPFVEEVLSTLINELQLLRKDIALRDMRHFETNFAALSNSFSRTDLDESLRWVYSLPPRSLRGPSPSSRIKGSGATKGHEKVSHKPKTKP